MSTNVIFGIGMLAQLLYASRLVAQWLISERQQKVVTPSVFWILSLIASILLFIYGYLRNDFAIMLGQFITYYIYIRNLQLQDKWYILTSYLKWLILITPIGLILYYVANHSISISHLLNDPDIPRDLLVLGVISQLIFTLRFVVQWSVSEKRKTSFFPLSFWIMSMIGALLILLYAIIRSDWVLIIGHSFGLLIYMRQIRLDLVKNTINAT